MYVRRVGCNVTDWFGHYSCMVSPWRHQDSLQVIECSYQPMCILQLLDHFLRFSGGHLSSYSTWGSAKVGGQQNRAKSRVNIVLIIIIRLTETASDLRTPRLSYDGSLTSGVTVNASGLPVWPADIQIKDIQAKTSCAVHQSFFTVQLATWDTRMELREDVYNLIFIRVWIQIDNCEQKSKSSTDGSRRFPGLHWASTFHLFGFPRGPFTYMQPKLNVIGQNDCGHKMLTGVPQISNSWQGSRLILYIECTGASDFFI